MDKAEENQDPEVEIKDIKTPEVEVKAPEGKKPAPEKTPKTYTEDDLRERGRDDATLAQKRKDLDEREGKIQEKEEKIKWQPVVDKYGEEGATKIKGLGLGPDALTTIAELLEIKVPPKVQKSDPGTTDGGGKLSDEDKLKQRYPTM